MPAAKRWRSGFIKASRQQARPKRQRRRSYGPTRGKVARIAKSVMLRACESKQSSQYTTAAVTLFHDRTYYAGQLLATTQGVRDPSGIQQATLNRIGDEVIARGLSLKFFLQNKSDRPNVMYVLYVFSYNVLLVNPAAVPPETLSDNEFWAGLGGGGAAVTNRILDKPQRRNIRVLKKLVIKPTNQANYSIQTAGPVPVGPFAKTNYVSCWIPLRNKKIHYRLPDSPMPERDGYGFAMVAYDAITTLTTDAIADMQWQSTFYFKDP